MRKLFNILNILGLERGLGRVNRSGVALRAAVERGFLFDELLALRDEIRRHKFVSLRHVTRQMDESLTHPGAYPFRIHHVKGEHVTVEAICIRYNKTRFCVFNVSLNEWEAKFENWIDNDDEFWGGEWESAFESHFSRHGDDDDSD